MLKVAIFGAGELGAGIASRLASRDWPGEVVLLGRDPSPTAGKALDLLEGNPVLGSGTSVRGAQNAAELAGAAFVVLAGPAGAHEDDEFPLEAAALVEAIRSLVRDAVVVVAGRAPESLLAAVQAAGLGSRRVFATSPEALAAAWRRELAAALGCSPQSVAVSVVGAPPRAGLHEVFASVAGAPAEELLSVAELRAIGRRIAARPPAGPRTLAAAATAALDDMARKDGAIHSCYAWAGGAYGARDLFIAAPSILGRGGVERILDLRLDPARRVTIDRAIDVLSEQQRLNGRAKSILDAEERGGTRIGGRLPVG